MNEIILHNRKKGPGRLANRSFKKAGSKLAKAAKNGAVGIKKHW